MLAKVLLCEKVRVAELTDHWAAQKRTVFENSRFVTCDVLAGHILAQSVGCKLSSIAVQLRLVFAQNLRRLTCWLS